MLNKRRMFSRFVPLIVFFSVLIFLWVGLHRNPREIPSPLIGKPAPDFNTPSLWDSQHRVSKAIFQGKVSVFNVFASWCVACAAEHSVLMEARQNSKNLQIIGLNYKDDPAKAKAWLKKYGDPYQQIATDPQGNIAINFGVYGTPETFIISPRGLICYKFIGALSPSDWKNTLLPEIIKCQE